MTLLIEAAELAALLRTEQPPVVADVRWNLGGPSGLGEFEAAHIPGAQWVDLETELAAPPGAGGRHPLPDPDTFTNAMRRIGLNNNSPIVVCDAGNSLPASRLWWMLTDAGATDVRVLNGGLAAWQAGGYEVESGPAHPAEAGDFQPKPGQRGQADAVEVLQIVQAGGNRPIIDVRAPERYSGETEPIDPVAGHIPTAVNYPSMANLAADGRFLPAEAIAERYAEIDADPIIYCGSGVTAAHTLLALESAGITSGVIYPGSWSDWITDPDRPVASS